MANPAPIQPEAGDATAASPQVILVVDDEEDILTSLQSLFELSLDDVKVVTADSGIEALKVLDKQKVDVIITDYKMPGLNGLDFLRKADASAPGVPRILITAFPDLDIAMRAINEAGIENFVTKPFQPDRVVEVVRSVLRKRRSQQMRDQSFARALDMLRRRLKAD